MSKLFKERNTTSLRERRERETDFLSLVSSIRRQTLKVSPFAAARRGLTVSFAVGSLSRSFVFVSTTSTDFINRRLLFIVASSLDLCYFADLNRSGGAYLPSLEHGRSGDRLRTSVVLRSIPLETVDVRSE